MKNQKLQPYKDLITEMQRLQAEIKETKFRNWEEHHKRDTAQVKPLEDQLKQADTKFNESFPEFIRDYGFELLESLPWHQDITGGLGNRLRRNKDTCVKPLRQGEEWPHDEPGTLMLRTGSENQVVIFSGKPKAVKRYFPRYTSRGLIGAAIGLAGMIGLCSSGEPSPPIVLTSIMALVAGIGGGFTSILPHLLIKDIKDGIGYRELFSGDNSQTTQYLIENQQTLTKEPYHIISAIDVIVKTADRYFPQKNKGDLPVTSLDQMRRHIFTKPK